MLLTQLLTPDWLIKRYLLDLDQFDTNGQLTGVPTGQNGQPFPDAMYQEQVRASTDRAEKQYDLIVKDLIQVTGERQSDTNWQTNDFVSFTLDKRPVRRLTRVQVQVGNFPPTDVPLDWWEIVDGDLGQVRLMPGVQSWAVSASGNIVMLMLQRQYQPGIWRFDYTAGFDGIEGMSTTYALGTYTKPALVGFLQATPSTAPASSQSFTATFVGADKLGKPATDVLTWAAGDADPKTGTVDFWTVSSATFAATAGTPMFTVESMPTYPLDASILDLVGNWATFGISDIAGDLLGGSGIASWSRSQDGTSTNVNTTSSPENHGFSAKQKQQRLRIKELDEAIKRRYSMPGIGAF